MSTSHAALPPPVSRSWVACAGLAVVTAWVTAWPGGLALAAAIVLGVALLRRPVICLLVALVAVHGWFISTPLQPLPPGRLVVSGVMATDVIEGRYGPYALIDLAEGPVFADLPEDAAAAMGDRVHIEGVARGEPGALGARRHRGTVAVSEFDVVAGPSSPLLRLGNAVRDRVIGRLAPLRDGRALLAGFLVGDTSGVEGTDEVAMTRAGLSHFTAVSGSNVALFLGLVYMLAGPIGIGPRRRAVIGLLAVPVFAAATRFEPSVMRASAMAGLALGGRVVGVVFETWQLLATAVVGLILAHPPLVRTVGFQLSVAATAGVILGSRWPVRGGRIARAAAVTVAAQAMVAPLLLLHFGLVPLLSPLANLVAAPLVAAATLIGTLGVIGPGFLVDVGAGLAAVVLGLARLASGWPQIGWVGLGILVAVTVIHRRVPRLRGAVALAGAGLVAAMLVGPTGSAPDPGVVVLDVGQGDAILLSGGEGLFALVDGGPDPVELFDSLNRYRVKSLALLIVSHVHADHVTGLGAVVGRIPVGRMWAAPDPHNTPAWEELRLLAEQSALDIVAPEVGESFRLGALDLVVEGPLRRYASPNDQSIVITVRGPDRSMLLAGDIETFAQAELGHLRADVLKVPHQGAATSDPRWLEAVGADLAVISVGPNDFGHPADWVITTLEASGATVVRTDLAGDVVVPLG